MNINDIHNGINLSSLTIEPFFTLNESLSLDELLNLSIKLPIDQNSIICDIKIASINNRLCDIFHDLVMKKLSNHEEIIEYVDLTIDYSPDKLFDQISLFNVMDFSYKNLICNTSICSEFKKSYEYNTDNFNNSTRSPTYEVGKFKNINLFVNDYIEYSDTRIYIFDNIEFNIGDLDISYISEYEFTINFHYSIKINKSKTIKVLYDINSNEYKRYIRDIKIKNILDDK